MHSEQGRTCSLSALGDQEFGVEAWLKKLYISYFILVLSLSVTLFLLSHISVTLSLQLRLIWRTERLPPFVFISILANRPFGGSPWETAVIAKIAVD